MGWDEYMELLSGQIRSSRARTEVCREIRAHIEDQAEAYRKTGMEPESAENRAVEQMGDPVEVGVEMDRIHRPKPGWKLILLICILSAAGLAAQYFSLYRLEGDGFRIQCFYTFLGVCLMAVIYRIDYSVVGKQAKILGGIFLAGTACLCMSGLIPARAGSYGFMKTLLYLFVPIYGCILYRYRNTGWTGPVKSFLWILAAAWVGVSVVGGGWGVTLDMLLICFLMFLYVLVKGWFGTARKGISLALAMGVPGLAILYGLFHMKNYQWARILALVQSNLDPSGGGFLNTVSREVVSSLTLWGSSPELLADQGRLPSQLLPGTQYDYIMLQIASTGGIAAAVIAIALLTCFYVFLARLAFHQKNQLGRLVGAGCVSVLALETARNLFNNFGFYSLSTGGLPFLSYGKCHTIVVYALLGVLLSIYRYQNLIWERRPEGTVTAEEGIFLRLGSYELSVYRRPGKQASAEKEPE